MEGSTGLASPPGSDAVAPARRRARAFARGRAFERLARTGLVTRGIVYGVVGVLALEVALRVGGKTASQRGALETIGNQPLGRVLLVAVAVGLAAYALWQLAVALLGLGDGGEAGPGSRIAAGFGGLAYAGLCATAVKILAGASTTGGPSSPKRDAAGVLGWTGGPLLIGIVGAIVIGVGLYQAYKGLARRFEQESDTARMGPAVKRAFVALGLFGHLARAVVFVLVGAGLVKAALDYSPRSAVGLDGALARLAHNPAGPVTLGAVAAGLLGFGLYSIVDARYHRV